MTVFCGSEHVTVDYLYSALEGDNDLSIDYQIHPAHNLVLARFRGEVSTEDHIVAFLEYTRNPGFKAHQHALVDLSECTLEESYFKDMQRLAYRLKTYYAVRAPSSRTSVYAPGDVVFGMSRMYQSIAEGTSPWEMGVFRTKVDSLEFLGIAPGSCEAHGFLAIWSD